MTPLGPFDGFAAALRARHCRRGGAVPPVEAVVLRVPQARAAAWHLHIAGTQVNVAPRIALTVAAERSPARAPLTARAPIVTARLRHSTSTVRVREARTLVEHTRTRGVRVERAGTPMASTPATPPTVGPPSLAPPAPPTTFAAPALPPLVVARAAPPTPGPTPSAVAVLEPARAARRNENAPAAPISAPSIDVERITDSVLGALDRRLIAHRERYGSI